MAELHKIIIINPGSTSTKFALYENDHSVFVCNLRHEEAELATFRGKSILEQQEFRQNLIATEIEKRGHKVHDLAAVAGRGGLLRPLASGTYKVNAAMLEELHR